MENISLNSLLEKVNNQIYELESELELININKSRFDKLNWILNDI